MSKRFHKIDRSSQEMGFTIIELLVTFSVFGILTAMAVSNLMQLERPLVSATSQTSGFLKQVRAKAVATTTAFRVFPASNTLLNVQKGVNCDSIDEDEAGMIQMMPGGVVLTDTDWEICFTPRGLADDNVVITLQDEQAQTRQIEVYIGGAVRVLN